MSKLVKLFVLLLSLAGLGLWGGNAYAATRFSVATGNWSNTATWAATSGGTAGASVPVAGDTVTVERGLTVTVDVAGACSTGCASASVRLGGLATGTGTLTFSAGSSLTVAGTVTMGGGGSGGNTRTGSITMTAGGTLTLQAFAYTSGTFTPGTGTVVLTATNTLPNNTTLATFNNLTISSGTTTLSRTLTVTSDLVVNGILAGTNAIALSGAAHNIDGTGSVTTTGTTTISASHTFLATAHLSFAGMIAVTGATTVVTNNGNTTSTAATGITGLSGSQWTNATNSTLNVSGPMFATAGAILNASAPGNLVNYTGAAQTVDTPSSVAGTATYYHLTLSGSGTKTMPAAALQIQGSFTMAGAAGTSATAGGAFTVGGDFVLGSGNTFNAGLLFSHSVAGNFTNNGGTFTASTSTVTLNGAATQTIGGTSNTTFNNLTVNGSGGVTLASSPTIGGTLTLTTGTFAVGANTLTLNGQAIMGTPANLSTTSSSNLSFGGTATSVTVPTSVTALNNLTINNTSGVSLGGSGVTRTLSGTLTLSVGTFAVGANTLVLNGPAIAGAGAATNLSTTSSSNLTFGGTAGGVTVPGSVIALNNLTINNSSGVTMGGTSVTTTLSGTVALSANTLTTGSNTLAISGDCTANGGNGSQTRTSGYVIGNLRLTFPGGNSTCIYHVGDSIGYAPITVDMVGATAGTLTGRVDAGDHPDTISSSSGIDSTKSANHYWTLTAGTLTTYTSYSATFQFCAITGSCTASEVDTLAATGNFIVARKISGTWSTPTVGTKNSYSTQATGITSANGFGAFAVGEVNLCFADSLSGVDGSAPGANWSVGFKTGTFGNPVIFGNRLRLTDATTGAATWATLQRLFPAAGNKITVEFEHFAYGGTATGADGIAVVFSDASSSPTAGAFGGSLGYAQKCENGVAGCVSDCLVVGGCPGFIGGWLGIALDEYGNFSTNIEGRFGGGASRVPESASIRGSGSGVSGYRFIQGTTTQSAAIDGDNVPPGPFVHRYRIIIDHTDTGGHAYVSVERDTTSGAGTAYTRLIAPFDIKDPGYSQSAIPTGFNVSFTGSTGSSTNIHEIRNLNICTAQGLAAPTLHHIEIDHDGSACTSGTETVTVKACANALCTSLYGGSVTVDLTPSAGGARTWAPTEPVTFTGGSVALTLANTAAGTVTLGGTATSPTTVNATQCFNGLLQTCDVAFSACTFDALEVSLPTTNKVIYTKLANTAFDLSVLSLSGTNQTASIVELVNASSGTCSAFPSLGNASTPVLPSVFTGNQRKTFSFTYNNAAPNVQVRVTNSASVVSCSSDNFAIRPQAYTVTSSASQSGSSGTPALRAGTDPFSLTATAVYGVTATSGYTGIPRLNSSLISTDQAHLGNISATTFPAAISGVSTASGLKYDEVGNFKLAQHAVYDDTFATVDSVKGECTTGFNNIVDGSGKFSCQFGLEAAVSPFGRFVPDHFDTAIVQAAGVPMDCPSGLTCPTAGFVYSGQPFSVQVTAKNAGGNTTQNYQGDFAKAVTLSAWNASGGAGANPGGNPLANNTGLVFGSTCPKLPSGFEAGCALTSGPAYTWPAYTLLTSTTPPTDIYVRADEPTGADGVTSLRGVSSVEGGVKVVSGRIRIPNAYGSELLALPLTATVQYYNGTYWLTSLTDTVTTISASDFVLAYPNGTVSRPNNLSDCKTSVSITGSSPSSPIFTINLSKPGTGNNGWTDLTLNLGLAATGNECTVVGGAGGPATTAKRPWLQYDWGNCNSQTGTVGLKDDNPCARATFGTYKSPLIYRRENY